MNTYATEVSQLVKIFAGKLSPRLSAARRQPDKQPQLLLGIEGIEGVEKILEAAAAGEQFSSLVYMGINHLVSDLKPGLEKKLTRDGDAVPGVENVPVAPLDAETLIVELAQRDSAAVSQSDQRLIRAVNALRDRGLSTLEIEQILKG